MEWILFLWLAGNPNQMVPIEFFPTRRECIEARKREVDANIQLGLGGGATYVCLANK